MAPKEFSEEALKNFRKQHFGYDFEKAKQSFQIDAVLTLRFDPQVQASEETFGPGIFRLPLSSGEDIYSYKREEDQIRNAGMSSLYAPSIPEFEHFLGHYVPRLQLDADSKAYVCRLPRNIEDGIDIHWLKNATNWESQLDQLESQGILPTLVSKFDDCRDWHARYGKPQVDTWMNEVKHFAKVENEIFLRLARKILKSKEDGKRILYHCSSGTDRVGRLSMTIESLYYKLTREELEAYRGMGTQSKVDLIVLNYLLSNRAGSKVFYRYMFPDPQNPMRSWLGLSLEDSDPKLSIPGIDALNL